MLTLFAHLLLQLQALSPQPVRPNILIVIADDLGKENVGAYGLRPDPHTPNIDALAARGARFNRFWAEPVCSPLRACVQTGRYGIRTGIGEVIDYDFDIYALPLAEVTIPELLGPTGYANAMTGKWHLSTKAIGADFGPNLQGWSHFDGHLSGFVGNTDETYYHWSRTTDGYTRFENSYATTVQINAAIDAVKSLPSPWVIVCATNAPHWPFHVPPQELTPSFQVTEESSPTDKYHADIEALDTEFGRLLAVLPRQTVVMFLGDNGTPNGVNDGPYPQNRTKGTVYQGGIETPLIVAGFGVTAGRVIDAPISAVDVFATTTDFAGVKVPSNVDGVSFRRLLTNGGLPTGSISYAEQFGPNGPGPFTYRDRAITDGRFKLIRHQSALDEYYDLSSDPYEQTNIIYSLSGDALTAYIKLVLAIVQIP